MFGARQIPFQNVEQSELPPDRTKHANPSRGEHDAELQERIGIFRHCLPSWAPLPLTTSCIARLLRLAPHLRGHIIPELASIRRREGSGSP